MSRKRSVIEGGNSISLVFDGDDSRLATIIDTEEQRLSRVPLAMVAITGAVTGSGFLIADDLVLTAHHVIRSASLLSDVRLTWGRHGGDRGKQLTATTTRFRTSTALDYTVFSVGGVPSDHEVLSLEAAESAPAVGDLITVFGYPESSTLRRSSGQDPVLTLTRDRLRYRADTFDGQSGGPVVMTESGLVVALHTQGDSGGSANSGVLVHLIKEDLSR